MDDKKLQFLRVLRGAIEASTLEFPANWRELIDEITTERGGFRYLSNLRKGASLDARTVKGEMDWHRGLTGGHLMGVMMRRMSHSREEFNKLDCLAVLLCGGKSAGLECWRKTGVLDQLGGSQ